MLSIWIKSWISCNFLQAGLASALLLHVYSKPSSLTGPAVLSIGATLRREEAKTTNAEEKLAHQRLFSVLELAEALGNSSDACRRRGIFRTQFYEYKRRFQQTHGIEGLLDLLPVHKAHPMTTPKKIQEEIVALSPSRSRAGLKLDEKTAKQEIELTAEQA
jgi:inner membrane protein involved in colicin E2 resistance